MRIVYKCSALAMHIIYTLHICNVGNKCIIIVIEIIKMARRPGSCSVIDYEQFFFITCDMFISVTELHYCGLNVERTKGHLLPVEARAVASEVVRA